MTNRDKIKEIIETLEEYINGGMYLYVDAYEEYKKEGEENVE